MNLKNGKVVTSKFVGIGPSFLKKRIYRAVFSQKVEKHYPTQYTDLMMLWMLGSKINLKEG